MDKDEIRELFDHYDADHNGVIDRDEFTKLCLALDDSFPEADITTGLGAIDANNNGKIEFDEFVAWWSERVQ